MQRTCSTRGFAREESPKAAGWRLPGGFWSPGNTGNGRKTAKAHRNDGNSGFGQTM